MSIIKPVDLNKKNSFGVEDWVVVASSLQDKLNEIINVINILITNNKEFKKLDSNNNNKEWINKVCWFWNEQDIDKHLGILYRIHYKDSGYLDSCGTCWDHCKPVQKDELSFVEDEFKSIE